ncbi:MAG TPA: helicase HerA-like domain-containing protein, partial [Chitinophagaceae bacterium]|nr:helicase HerA-like domain-containing protein [Chitinophagaceae bacterium]
SQSKIAAKYNQVIDSKSAHEILTEKLKEAAERGEEEKEKTSGRKREPKEKTIFDDPVVRSMTRTAGNTIVRSLLGALGLGGKSRRRLF